MLDNLPPELIEKIFFRLPIADVLRCTSVCTSWYTLITSSSFISLHLISSIDNTESRVILSLKIENDTKEHYYLHRDNQEFDEIQELKTFGNPNAEFEIRGSSNGVFCCSYERIGTGYGQRFILWNPSLRKSLILPKSRDRARRSMQQCNVGFGFLPSSDNFKIVRVIYSKNSDGKYTVPPEAEIYEFRTGSWRDVDASELSYALEVDCGHALLKGIVHWTACDLHVERTCTYGGLIVSFDLTSEKFGTLMLPDCVQYDEKPNHFCLFTTKEYLCLLHCDERTILFKMKEYGVKESWEKLFDFGTVGLNLLYLRENGEILMAELIDEILDKYSLVSCNPKTNEMMDLGVHEDGLYFCAAYAYVDSLFLI